MSGTREIYYSKTQYSKSSYALRNYFNRNNLYGFIFHRITTLSVFNCVFIF